jgi:two-component system cell cycle sensor histidine kinase/response regulator CckA
MRVLLLEDDATDAEIVIRELKRTVPDCRVRRVDRRSEFIGAFDEETPDLVLSDHRMAEFSGMHALEYVRQRSADVPFIFVTGALDEETAVECVKAGASDYVLKDRLARLGPAVTAALELREARRALTQSQEQLLHTQRLDALGQLAGSVAHDYNNLMTAVIGYAELLAETMDNDPRRSDVEEITRAGQRAAALTRQLLAFSRKQVIDMAPLHLGDVIAGVERLLTRLGGERTKLDIRCAENLPLIRGDQGQLEQVLVNLVVNGRDAMPHGGQIDVDLRAETLVASASNRKGGISGPCVSLTVRDTGEGIPVDVLPHIFEPFFTTKPRGRGTGLGLSTVYGIVRQCGGHIVVDSTVGIGTTFRLYFPVTDDLPRRPYEARAATLAGTEVVLVVEDDPGVLGYARRVLASHGYHVFTASDASTALAIVSAQANIDLMLADVTLPDRSGVELAQHVRRLQPQTKILMMSGYIDRAIEEGSDISVFKPIQKPLLRQTLLERIRSALESPQNQR